jgi:hypothetical protein
LFQGEPVQGRRRTGRMLADREGGERMRRGAWLIGGVVLVLVGAVWTVQGLGYLPGSVMTGVRFWAVVGPVVAIVGVLLVVHGVRGIRKDGRGRRV